MKKILIITLNIILCFLILIAADYFIAVKDFNNSFNDLENKIKAIKYDNNENLKTYISSIKTNYTLRLKSPQQLYLNENMETPRRKVSPENVMGGGKCKIKPPILLFGCSFAYGAFLNDNETFAYKLAKLTGRTVYNRAFSGQSPAFMLWMTRYDKFYNDLKSDKLNPEYAIWVYIPYHNYRLYSHRYGLDLNTSNISIGYNKVNDTLVENKSIFIKNLCRLSIFKKIFLRYYYSHHMIPETFNQNFDYLKLHFIESRRALQKKFPDIKFIIIKHYLTKNLSDYDKKLLTTEKWKELEEDGFIIYDLKKEIPIDLTNEEYLLPDGHPNSKTWDIVSEKIIKDLKL